MHPITGQSLQGEGRDEFSGGRRHGDVNFCPCLHQKAGEFGALVGSDAAGDAEQDALVSEA